MTMKIKVMTFNIRYDNKDDGKNCFDGRKALIKEFLQKQKPDVVGFQEVLPHVRAWLCENMQDYTVIGAGRNADFGDESATVAFRKDKFDLLGFSQFWLSDTPDVPGSRYHFDQSSCARVAVKATLVERDSGKVFVFANTHLDHIGSYAKVSGAALIMSKILCDKLPFVLCGDFNSQSYDGAYKEVVGNAGVYDLTSDIKDVTFHDFGKISKDSKIDYIFSNAKAVDGTLVCHKDKCGDVYLSDHYPISVCVEI